MSGSTRAWTRASGLCEICGVNPATEWHHLFPQTKTNKRLYGVLIHRRENIVGLCHGCHEKAQHISEREFCGRLGIKPRSKSGKL